MKREACVYLFLCVWVLKQDRNFSERVMLLYDGLHYDALAVSLSPLLSHCCFRSWKNDSERLHSKIDYVSHCVDHLQCVWIRGSEQKGRQERVIHFYLDMVHMD